MSDDPKKAATNAAQNTATTRPRTAAVAPLNTIAPEDIAAGASKVDKWLRSISNDIVTLDRLKMVAGSLPVVGNIMALVDVFGDIITLTGKKAKEASSSFLDWVSLGINLIGVVPVPPSMAAARMSLRPALVLVRQQLARGLKEGIGFALIEVLVTHLNAKIIGEIDDFVKQAQAKLSSVLNDAGELGQKIILELANGMDNVVQGKLDAAGSLSSSGKQLSAAKDSLLNDPKKSFFNIFGAIRDASVSAGKYVVNTAVRLTIPESVKIMVFRETGKLRSFAVTLGSKIKTLADPNTAQSIGWLLLMLSQAIVRWRKKKSGQTANVQAKGTTQSRKTGGEGELGTINTQHPSNKNPKKDKNGSCPSTCNSITFAMGTETITHVDFTLPGPFPLQWWRTYSSDLEAYDKGVLGARWLTPFQIRIDCQGNDDQSVTYYGADGRKHSYPLPRVGETHHDSIENQTLIRVDEHLLCMAHGHNSDELFERIGDHYRLISISLRNGARAMLYYNHLGNGQNTLSDLITLVDGEQHTHVHTELDDYGRISSVWEIKDEQPRRLATYQYDEQGDLIAAFDENEARWDYQYQHHLLTRYTDRTGRGFNLEWNGEGPDAKAVHEWADDGSFDTRLEWDENIRLTYVTDALGNETWHYYDILGYTYRIDHPDGRSEWLFRDDDKNVVRHVHPDGSTDCYAYDERSNVIEHIRPDGSVVHYAWDDQDQLIKISDGENGVWTRAYDGRGNLIETIDPLGNKTEYSYDVAGNLTGVTDAAGNEKALKYNSSGQLIQFTDCSGKISTWEYDDRNQLIRFTDAAGQVTEHRYVAGHRARTVHPDKTEDHFEYDAEGRLLSHTDALERKTLWAYNAAGMIASRTDAAGGQLKYHWDKTGRLTGLTNENERSLSFVYDPVGRLLEETSFDGQVSRYQYDEGTGVLAEKHDSNRVIAYDFDAMGRLVERKAGLKSGDAEPVDWQHEHFAYNGEGQLVLAENALSRLQWFHDDAGNLIREHQHYRHLEMPQVAVWTHEYDALNQRIATIRPDGHKIRTLTYGNGHLLALYADDRELLSYERDDLHREIGRRQGNALLQQQAWDPNGRLLEQTLNQLDAQGKPGNRLISRVYQYDAAGQLVGINDSRRGQLSYRYDPIGRLLKAVGAMGEETFAFDPAGNLVDEKASEAHNPYLYQNQTVHTYRHRSAQLDNLLRKYAGTHYRYDDRGNLLERWHNGKRDLLHWDLFDRLVRFEDETLSVEYGYDALGRRLHKHSQVHFKASPGVVGSRNQAELERLNKQHGCGFTLFGWDGDTLAWESTQQHTKHFIYEPGIFVPIAQGVHPRPIVLQAEPVYGEYYDISQDPLWISTPEAGPFEHIGWYQCDHLGTPQEITDERGEVVWSAQSKAWGETAESCKAEHIAYRTPIRFQGQYQDHETKLHYNRYRYYDPVVGRFISKDPIDYAGGLNLFQYTTNPIGWTDPLGLSGKCCLPKCNDLSSTGPKTAEEMALELSQQINSNSVSFSTVSTQGHIDLKGREHYDKNTQTVIPTPHVQTRDVNIGPNGQVTTSKKTEVTRAATKQDVRVARELARRKGLCR